MLADEKPLYAMQVKRSAFEGCPPPLFDEPSGQRIHDLALWVARDELTVIELRAEGWEVRETTLSLTWRRRLDLAWARALAAVAKWWGDAYEEMGGE